MLVCVEELLIHCVIPTTSVMWVFILISKTGVISEAQRCNV